MPQPKHGAGTALNARFSVSDWSSGRRDSSSEKPWLLMPLNRMTDNNADFTISISDVQFKRHARV